MLIRNLVLSIALSAALTGCVSRVNATDEESVKKSVAALAGGAPKELRASVDAAAKRYLDVYFGDAEKPATAPEWFVVDRMGPAEFVRYVEHFLAPPPAQEKIDDKVDQIVTRQYRDSLKLAKTLLEKARARAHATGNYTVDQFEWKTPEVVPPDPKAYANSNPVTFKVPFTNHSGFDVYHPQFRVIIKFPEMDYAVFDDVVGSVSDDPVPAESEVMVTLACCTTQENETLNQLMRAPPPGTVYEYALVGVGDYGKKQALDNSLFPQGSMDTLKRVEACLADMDAQGDNWKPSTAAPVCREYDELMSHQKRVFSHKHKLNL